MLLHHRHLTVIWVDITAAKQIQRLEHRSFSVSRLSGRLAGCKEEMGFHALDDHMETQCKARSSVRGREAVTSDLEETHLISLSADDAQSMYASTLLLSWVLQ